MKTNRRALRGQLILATAIAIGLAGCAKKPPQQLPPQPAGPNDGQTDGGQSLPRSLQDQFLAAVSSDRIYFATDDSGIDAEDRNVLQSQASWLRANPSVRITIEGHCDERGTRDYNIALGARRANAAKNYLASLGIDTGRIATISYGKERPVAMGSDESAYAQNRRAVTVTVEY